MIATIRQPRHNVIVSPLRSAATSPESTFFAMKLDRFLPLLALATVLVTTALAQPLISPEIRADRSVTFRLNAPTAKDVMLYCEAFSRPQSMRRDEQGIWTFSTTPIAPDIYVYSFVVDGQRVLDPLNPEIKYNLFSTENQLHVPGPTTLPWEINDVPHGVIHRHHYRSVVVGEERDVWIYTPPGYDSATAQKLPVLYLLHGFSDSEDAWVSAGRANIILDNLIARGEAKPMLVVMPRGYGNGEVISNSWELFRTQGWQATWQDSNAKYGESLLNEIIPLVEKNYRVASDRNSRAIAGLSMGGTQSLLIGLNSPDRFAWIASFSAGGIPEDYEKNFPGMSEKLSQELRLLWIGCGTEDGLIADNRKFSSWLKSRGVANTREETPGRHTFLVWRRYLTHVVPMLFQDAPTAPVKP
jgi:enterochelin esterase family protein